MRLRDLRTGTSDLNPAVRVLFRVGIAAKESAIKREKRGSNGGEEGEGGGAVGF